MGRNALGIAIERAADLVATEAEPLRMAVDHCQTAHAAGDMPDAQSWLSAAVIVVKSEMQER